MTITIMKWGPEWTVYSDIPDEEDIYCRGIHETFDSAILHSDILSLEGAFN